VGSNLDKIVEVQIPGSEPITEIEVVASGRVSEIRVVTPAAGAEDASVTGPVVIVDNAGNTYKSKTDITFTEGIVIESFSPATAMPGDVVTVKGDYLYNVQQVVLSNGVYVTGDQITEKTRRELKFIVPSNAVTGPVTIGDVDENNNPEGLIPNNVPSKTELVIGDPTVKAADRGMLKAGAEITVQGEYLDMIAKAAFRVTTPAAEEGGEATVADTEVDFTLAADNKSVKVALPATVVEGEIVLTSFAGKEFKAGAYTTVIPTEIAIAAETRYKAGLNAVVTGKDLDLVTKAELAGTALEFGYADNKVTFAIPSKAVDGTVVLTLANGKTVATEAIELVKPTITEMTPLELYAGDENITVKGTDLDLIVAAALGGREAEFEYANEEIIVKTALTSVSGKVALTLDNGVVVESADEVKVNYHSLVIVTEMPAMQHIGQEVVLKGSNFSLVENIFIGDVKVTQYSLRTDEEVRFLMPWNKAGMYNLSFHLFSGDVETVATQIEVGLELDIKTIWEGEASLVWSGMQDLAWGGYDWSTVKPGTVLTAYFTLHEADYWQVRFANGSWASIPSGVEIASSLGQGDGNIPMTAGATYYAIKLTAADIDMLVNQGGLVMTGANYTLTKLTLTSEISQETTLWEGEMIADDWGSQPYALSDGGAELQQAGAQPGQVVYFYFEQIGADPWKVEIVEGHWGPTYRSICAVGNDTEGGKFTEYDLDANGGKYGLTLTQEMLDAAYAAGGWGGVFVLNGDNTKCTKITLL
jgi:signal peptidase I